MSIAASLGVMLLPGLGEVRADPHAPGEPAIAANPYRGPAAVASVGVQPATQAESAPGMGPYAMIPVGPITVSPDTVIASAEGGLVSVAAALGEADPDLGPGQRFDSASFPDGAGLARPLDTTVPARSQPEAPPMAGRPDAPIYYGGPRSDQARVPTPSPSTPDAPIAPDTPITSDTPMPGIPGAPSLPPGQTEPPIAVVPVSPVEVPEPSTVWLVGAALAAMLGLRRVG